MYCCDRKKKNVKTSQSTIPTFCERVSQKFSILVIMYWLGNKPINKNQEILKQCCKDLRIATELSIAWLGCDHIEVYGIRYTICSPPQMTFKWCNEEGTESCLWRRANRIAYSEYRILLCDHSLIIESDNYQHGRQWNICNISNCAQLANVIRTQFSNCVHGASMFTWSCWHQIASRKGESRQKYSVRICVAKRTRWYAQHKGDNFMDVQPSECDALLGKSVWSQACDIFSFLFDWTAYLKRYILLKTPLESDQWFQSYEQLKYSQNNRKQKKFIPFFWLYLAINAPNFQLIPLDRNTCLFDRLESLNVPLNLTNKGHWWL